jgi:FixJ family two-component response regulator
MRTITTMTAIVVHDEEEPFRDLKRRLSELGIPSIQLRTFVETKYFLKRLHGSALIFTAIALPDGNWADVVEAAQNATPPCPVIVVSRFVDLHLYLEALQKGAADFIVAPFRTNDLQSIIHSAMMKLADAREPASTASVGLRAPGAAMVEAEDQAAGSTEVSRTEAGGRTSTALAR